MNLVIKLLLSPWAFTAILTIKTFVYRSSLIVQIIVSAHFQMFLTLVMFSFQQRNVFFIKLLLLPTFSSEIKTL